MVASTKHKRKEERQAVLREYLAERGKLSYIFDNIEKMESAAAEMSPQELQALGKANEQRIRLLAKYLPDTKEVQIDALIHGEIDNNWTVNIVDAHAKPK